MKKLLLILSASLLLAGCWSTTKTQEVSFENFKMNIDSDFKKTDPTTVDNKYITNKVLLSYKKAANNGFSDNFMIGKTQVSSWADSDIFAQMVTAKLSAKVYSLNQIKTDSVEFKCWDTKYKWTYAIFSTPQNLTNTESDAKNYFMQYYFVNWWYWYIISFATTAQKTAEWFVDSIKSLNCN